MGLGGIDSLAAETEAAHSEVSDDAPPFA